jgi:hypothetical protein
MIRCIRFRPYVKNTLRGFADLQLVQTGIVIRELTPRSRSRSRSASASSAGALARSWMLLMRARQTPDPCAWTARERTTSSADSKRLNSARAHDIKRLPFMPE